MFSKLLKIMRLPQQTVTIIPFLYGLLDSHPQNLSSSLLALSGLLLLSISSFVINEYIDSFDTDLVNERAKKAQTLKPYKTPITVLMTILLLGTLSIFAYLQLWLPLLFGLFWGIGYSLPPLRFKAHFPWDMISLLITFVALPYLIPFFLTNQPFAGINFQLVFPLLFGFTLQGIHLLGDAEADKQAGITNWCIHFGYRPFILMMDKACLAALIILAYLIYSHQSPWLYPLGIGLWYLLMILGYTRSATSRLDLEQLEQMMSRTYKRGVKLAIIALLLTLAITLVTIIPRSITP